MSDNATKVAITRRLPADIETRMGELFDAQFNADDAAPDRAALSAMMANNDVLVPTVTDRIDAALINGAGDRLKLIANFGNGTDDFGFFALPGGRRISNSSYFHRAGSSGYWWSSSPSGDNSWHWYLHEWSTWFGQGTSGPRSGFSVRCLRDAE